jgi:hypothetical protein
MAKPTTEVAIRESDPIDRDHWLVRLLEWPIRQLGRLAWWLLRQAGAALWRHRDLHFPWWISATGLACATVLHVSGATWWLILAGFVALGAIAYAAEQRWDRLPVEPETAAGGFIALGCWAAAATAWGLTRPVLAVWLVLTLTTWCAWWWTKQFRRWRSLRLRVRNWRAQLPVVLAELGAAAVVVASVLVDGAGRVEFRLRLPVRVTRRSLEKMRDEITSAMHWPENSIREIAQDPAHSSAARVVLIWQPGRIEARTVHLDAAEIPSSIYDALWIGVDEQGRPVYIEQYAPEGMTRGLLGGESGSAKSNLLRLIAKLRAYCPDLLIWVIDRKNSGNTFASILPRIDWIATTREEAIRMLEAAAAVIPLRGRLLLPEHNQLLPLSADLPGILIIYDEFSDELGKSQRNRSAIDAAKLVVSQGRAAGVGMEAASQYPSQGSLHPDLRTQFPRGVAGRTKHAADAQFLIKNAHRVDTTILPTGGFYVQLPAEARPILVFTPEVADADLAQTAREAAHLAPTLEASTADLLPHYADRWTRLPDHLLSFCSPEQLRMVDARPSPTLRAAAADRPRMVVHERVEDVAEDDTVLDTSIAAMCDLLLGSDTVTTAELDAAALPRKRAWAHARRAAWAEMGLIHSPERGTWSLLVRDREALADAVAECERRIRARRSIRGR